MNEKNFTPEEIAKSLRACTTRPSVPYVPCEGCVLKDDPLAECYYEVNSIAAELIEEQAKRIAEMEEQLRWVPVEERLPEHNKSVLVCCENFTIQGGHTVHIGSCDTACESNFWFLRTQPGVSSYPNHEWRVTHWKPIPEGPGI